MTVVVGIVKPVEAEADTKKEVKASDVKADKKETKKK